MAFSQADRTEIRDENPEAEDASSRPSNSNGPADATSNTAGSSNAAAGAIVQVEGVSTDSALVVTTNPLYPGAIMKKGAHGSHRASTGGRASDVHAQPSTQAGEVEGVEGVEGRRAPRGSMSRNGQTVSFVASHQAWSAAYAVDSDVTRQRADPSRAQQYLPIPSAHGDHGGVWPLRSKRRCPLRMR